MYESYIDIVFRTCIESDIYNHIPRRNVKFEIYVFADNCSWTAFFFSCT